MKIRTETKNGRRTIVITRSASGEDKTKEAALVVMGPGWEYKDKVQA